jgi:hypothetical protein
MSIQNTAIPGSLTPTTIYSSTGSTAITTLIFCNTYTYDPANPATGTTTLTLHVIPSGGSRGPANMILNAMPIPAGETFTFDTEKVVLDNSDTVVALASAANLSATVSYMSVV